MKTEAKKRLVFLGTVLALLLPPPSAQGATVARGLLFPGLDAKSSKDAFLSSCREYGFLCRLGQDANLAPTSDEEVLSSEEEVLEALWALEDGQTLKLGVREVRLNATVPISASDIVIHGAPEMTGFRCPPDGSAFVVSGSNVTFSNLNLSDCRNAAALRIDGGRSRPTNRRTTDSKGPGFDGTDPERQERRVFVRSCLFQGNKAPKGAAISARRSRLAVVNTTFVRNKAAEEGGAVYVFRGEIEVEASTFRQCSAKNGNGGAIRAVAVGKLTVSQSLFEGNFARSHAYILLEEGHGGGIAARRCPRATVTESTFLNNNSGRNGGGISGYTSSVTIRGSTFLNNRATILGGGVYAGYGGLTVLESTFWNNRAAHGYGGGAFAKTVRTATIRGSNFLNNSVTHYGGGVDLRGGDVTIKESTFLDNSAGMLGGGAYVFSNRAAAIRESTFSNNKAKEDGGGVSVDSNGNVPIRDSTFSNNKAQKHGGGVTVGRYRNVKIRESTFSNNRADENGGGAHIKPGTDVSIEESTFQKNSAQSGGALFSSSVTLIANSTVVSNIAKEGGGGMKVEDGGSLSLSNTTWRNNHAPFGGALGLSAGSSMPECHECDDNLVQGNVAFRGGGLFCQACRMDWEYSMPFVENVAAESGGGMCIEEAVSYLWSAKLVRNVAAFGGGIALKDNTGLHLEGVDVKENVAIEGGGLYISSMYGRGEEYRMRSSKLVLNQALSLQQMGNLSQQIPTVFKWLRERNAILSRGEKEWLRQKNYLQGRGGGMFISLKNQREGSSVKLKMSNLSIKKNSALIGGGIYVDNEVLIDGKIGDCGPSELLIRSCLEMQYEEIALINNTASVAGGGTFVHVMDNASRYGIQEKTLLPAECDDKRYDYEMCYHNNRILSDDGGGYGPQIATRATSSEFLNVDGPLTGLTAGERLAVFGGGNSVAGENIQLILRDALGRRISGETVDSGLTFKLHSNWISGKLRYRPVNGSITIKETYVAGYNISDTLVIKPSSGRKLMASVKFSTLPCPDGELPSKYKTECFKCLT